MHDRTIALIAARLDKIAAGPLSALDLYAATAARSALADCATVLRTTADEMSRAGWTTDPTGPDVGPAVAAYLASDDGRRLIADLIAQADIGRRAQDAARDELRAMLQATLDTLTAREF